MSPVNKSIDSFTQLALVGNASIDSITFLVEYRSGTTLLLDGCSNDDGVDVLFEACGFYSVRYVVI